MQSEDRMGTGIVPGARRPRRRTQHYAKALCTVHSPGEALAGPEHGGELMRGVLFAFAAMWLLVSAPRVDASALSAAAVPAISAPSVAAFALQVPDKKIDVTVGERSGGGVWYRSPVWIAIGVL